VNNNVQQTVVVARCEATARQLGHALNVWYSLSEHLSAILCKNCGSMVWVTRSGTEEDWRIGGAALLLECLDYELGVETSK
jgi:hypothetical protein